MWILGRPFSRWVTLNKCRSHREMSTNEESHTTLHFSYEQVLLQVGNLSPFPSFSEPPSFLSMSSNGSLFYSPFTICELQNFPPLHLRQGLALEPWLAWYSLCISGWTQNAGVSPTSAYQVLDDRNVLLRPGTALKAWIASYFLACNHSVQSLL